MDEKWTARSEIERRGDELLEAAVTYRQSAQRLRNDAHAAMGKADECERVAAELVALLPEVVDA